MTKQQALHALMTLSSGGNEMISDEQIARIFNKHGANFFAGARELITLAQQVEPLKFKRLHSAVFAHTEFGDYEILHTSDDMYCRPDGDGYYYDLANSGALEVFATEAEAVEAANADYKRRVLECLVNGGV